MADRTPQEGVAPGALTHAFEARYGACPTHLACAPGRVNLIGEHIDYAGLPVFPMAIQRQIRIAFRAIEEPECRIASDVPGLEPRLFRLDRPIEPYAAGDWGNYVKAAAIGLRQGTEAQPGNEEPSGIEAFIASDLPVAAGLSSSSALVIASALALTTASDEQVRPLELAALMADAEQFTGTRGGGMDQAICLCAREGTASVIDFDPLRIDPVPVPDDWRFVVAYSLVEARKSDEAQATYNRRRAEVETALSQVLEAGERSLEPELRRRYRHVVTEAARVRRAEDAMKKPDMSAFGALMNASHRSLREDFEVSTPELNELLEIALDAGAAGARLTGAGLGGSIVALVPADRSATVVDALRDGFYTGRLPPDSSGSSVKVDDALFVAAPSAGASVRPIDPGHRD